MLPRLLRFALPVARLPIVQSAGHARRLSTRPWAAMGAAQSSGEEPTGAAGTAAAAVSSSEAASTPELLSLPRTLGTAAPKDTASRTGAFQTLPMVAPSKELLESAVRRAGRVGPNKKLKNEAQKAKNRWAKPAAAVATRAVIDRAVRDC